MEFHEFIAKIRRETKALGGVKLKMQTFSWGPHCSWTFAGPNGETHEAGSIAPTWWSAEHSALYQKLQELRSQWYAEFKTLFPDGSLPGLKP